MTVHVGIISAILEHFKVKRGHVESVTSHLIKILRPFLFVQQVKLRFDT